MESRLQLRFFKIDKSFKLSFPTAMIENLSFLNIQSICFPNVWVFLMLSSLSPPQFISFLSY